MLNNNYETLFSHVLKYIPDGDELLQLITFFKLHFTLTDIDEHYNHFIYEMDKLDLLEKATWDGNLICIFKAIINNNDQIEASEKAKACDYTFASAYGMMRSLTIKQFEKQIMLSNRRTL